MNTISNNDEKIKKFIFMLSSNSIGFYSINRRKKFFFHGFKTKSDQILCAQIFVFAIKTVFSFYSISMKSAYNNNIYYKLCNSKD